MPCRPRRCVAPLLNPLHRWPIPALAGDLPIETVKIPRTSVNVATWRHEDGERLVVVPPMVAVGLCSSATRRCPAVRGSLVHRRAPICPQRGDDQHCRQPHPRAGTRDSRTRFRCYGGSQRPGPGFSSARTQVRTHRHAPQRRLRTGCSPTELGRVRAAERCASIHDRTGVDGSLLDPHPGGTSPASEPEVAGVAHERGMPTTAVTPRGKDTVPMPSRGMVRIDYGAHLTGGRRVHA